MKTKVYSILGSAILAGASVSAATVLVNEQDRLSDEILKTTGFAVVKTPAAGDKAIRVLDCPKCPCRAKLAHDGKSATVNVSRVLDSSVEKDRAAALKRTVAKVAALLEDIPPEGTVKRPLMGWSSWNCFSLNINEEKLVGVAAAMATNGLKAAGYRYVNMDDGFFTGHDPVTGKLQLNQQRFPKGLKPMVDRIHALGMKAGTYSDAGADACGGAKGVGLYRHDDDDCRFHFLENGFDFIKVDYCGGRRLKLDERKRYTEIRQAIDRTGRKDIRYNICRWTFPGTWCADVAESWRTTGDIRANWKSIKKLIGLNLYLSAYSKPGHYNDLDMLEVGMRRDDPSFHSPYRSDTGLTRDEEITHFGLWCMFSSPLVLGCDVRRMFPESLKLATNRSLLKVNQNDLGLHARVAAKLAPDVYVFVKDADRFYGTARYVAFYNGSDADFTFEVPFSTLELGGRVEKFDLVEEYDYGAVDSLRAVVPPHGSAFYRLDADQRLERVVYEAEDGYCPEFQRLRNANNNQTGTAHEAAIAGASGGYGICFFGGRPGNDLLWKDVHVSKAGKYRLEFRVRPFEDRPFAVAVNGAKGVEIAVPPAPKKNGFITVSTTVTLKAGVNEVRLSAEKAWGPDIDFMKVQPADAN